MRRIALFLLLAVLAIGADAQTVRMHTVQSGETLYRIATRYDLTVDQLRELNGLSGTVIRVGQKLRVSAPPDAPSRSEPEPATGPEPTTSLEVNSTRQAIESADDPAPPGTTIQPVRPNAPVIAAEPNAYGRYEVNASISLYDVAAATGLSVDSLLAMNRDLGPVFPDPGFIRVPVDYSVRDYRVKRGDTLFGIARQEGTSIEAIRTLNSLSGDRIRVGQRLKLPGTGGASPAATALPDADFEGTITEYPEQFAGRLTSGGDAYDPARFTAAHAELEIGTLVLLTHEASGRSVFAEINDRMPVQTDYVLEVSSAVSEALQASDEPVQVRVIAHD